MGHNGERLSLLPLNPLSLALYLGENFLHILLEFPDRHCIAGVEWKSDHTLDFGKVDFD